MDDEVMGEPEPDEEDTDVLGGPGSEVAAESVMGRPEPDERGTDVMGGPEHDDADVMGGPEPDGGADIMRGGGD